MKNNIITINNIKYKVVEDYGNCIDISEIETLLTDYFEAYDYICGDYSYDKLRLKGFNDKTNKNFNSINDINSYKRYIEELCPYRGKHFLLKKVNK